MIFLRVSTYNRIRSRCVSMLNFYSWTSNTTSLDVSSLLLNTVNWEDSSFLLNNDFFFILNLLGESFASIYVSFFSNSPLSLFDFAIVQSYVGSTLSSALMYDSIAWVQTLWPNLSLIFTSYSTDYLILNTLTEFSANSIVYSFINYTSSFTITTAPTILYDAFNLNPGFSLLDYIVFIKWFLLFIFFILMLPSHRIGLISSGFNFFLARFYFFLSSFGFDNRVSIDLALLFLSFVFFVWVVLLIAFDDIFSEVVELFHGFLVFILLFIIVFLLGKYSIHYWAFLENTVSEGYTTAYVTKQMVRDLSNTFALFLRFFLLLFRLNIYDGLDDFLDSYYIFFCDFDEDSYFDEDMLGTNFFHYFQDNQEDNVFFHPNEQDWFHDLFSRYWVIWGKLFLFIFFILEEAFRASLALYIFYLIIFEVHSVNLSYFEDDFISKKRS